MARRLLATLTTAGLFVAAAGLQPAQAQKVTAVPHLNLPSLDGSWYEVSRFQTKFEKLCAGEATVLFADGDKPRTFQMGTFCPGKTGTPQENNLNGKADKHGTGKLKSGFLPLFTTKIWVLALAPDGSWALLGQPNRKRLSVLSRTPDLPAETLTQIKSQAAAEGFKTEKLTSLPKLGKTYRAENGQLKVTPAVANTVK